MKDFFCKNPFFRVEIYPDGSVGSCCPPYTNNYTFGNVLDDDLDEIWNGEKIQEFRKSILDGSCKYCNKDMCMYTDFFPTKTIPRDSIKYPSVLDISIDNTCNFKCVTCRDTNFVNNLRILEIQENLYTKLLPWFENCKEVCLNGTGEFFVSKVCQDFVKKTLVLFPKLKYSIITNGSYCTPEKLKELNLIKRINYLSISLHSLNPETHEKITRSGGMFDKVMENIYLMNDLCYHRKIKALALNFVISSLNYKEIVDLAKFCIELNIEGRFWEFRKWDDSIMCKEHYDDYNVTAPIHPEYNELKKLLKDKCFEHEKICLNGVLLNIRNS